MTGEFNLVPYQPMTADHPASMVMTGKEEMTACSTTFPSLERDVVYEEYEKLITENSNLQAGLRIHLILSGVTRESARVHGYYWNRVR